MRVQHLIRASPRVNRVLCRIFVLRLELTLHLLWKEEWVLVHWQVVLQLLARVQPLARLQPLRDLYRLTPEEEALLPHPPLGFDTHCNIDRIWMDFRLARSTCEGKSKKSAPMCLQTTMWCPRKVLSPAFLTQ